jgi:hypothetical protein
MIQHHGDIPSKSLVSPQLLQLGEQVKRFSLVALERTQADAIEERTDLYLRAAFLDREPSDLLLTEAHAVNNSTELGTGEGTWCPVRTPRR